MRSHFYEYRKFVLAGIALVIVLCYIVRLAFLQLSDGEYKTRADDNAFFNNVIFYRINTRKYTKSVQKK